jgi:hypothetical protein
MKDIALYLAYVPIVAVFAAFVVGGGILLPLWEYLDTRKDRSDAEVIELPRTVSWEKEKVAA